MSRQVSESTAESAALTWLAALGYTIRPGPEVADEATGAPLLAEMRNPMLVIITDRNDLDQQLFGTFARCQEVLRQQPVQAPSRADLRDKLQVAAGGVIIATIQKLLPENHGDRLPLLSDRRNIVAISAEPHRSQYDFIDGLARRLHDALPNASFIGFTGTPIELTDRNTRAVFGDYISCYDIRQAVLDGATVPIYYEGRLAQLASTKRSAHASIPPLRR